MITFSRSAIALALFVVTAAALVGCSQPSAPSPKSVRSGGALVASIRAAGTDDHSVVRVRPLHNQAVSDLVAKAQREEAAQHFDAAARTLNHALELAPGAPDILQDRAEVAVRLGRYAEAEKLALRSFRAGPKVGALCARNWQTVLEMRRIAKGAAGVQSARKALAKCHESGPVRM